MFLSGSGSSVGHVCDQYSLDDLLSSVMGDLLHSNLMTLLPASTSDIVVAATAINVDLSVEATSKLCTFLKTCFPRNHVVINECAEGTAPSLLVNWVRAWVDIAAAGREEASSSMIQSKKSKTHHVDANVMLLCGTLFDHGRSEACCLLLPHISQGRIFNHEPTVVLNFIRILIHGHRFLNASGNSSVPLNSFLVESLRRVPKPYPKDLKEFARTMFDPYGTLFDYLRVSFMLQEGPGLLHQKQVVEVLKFSRAKTTGTLWHSPQNDIEILWTGKNWTLHLSRHNVAVQELKGLYKQHCIPRLGCLQSSGKWNSQFTFLSNVQVTLASESDWDSQDANASFSKISASLGPVFPWQNITSSNDIQSGPRSSEKIEMATHPSSISSVTKKDDLTLKVAVVEQRDHSSELRKTETNVTRKRVAVPESVFSLLSPFLSWNPILNVFHSLESVSVSVLQDLLERCLWLWACRNDEYNEMQEFYSSAIQSLQVYDGKRSSGKPGWESFFEKYGCYETPPLWTWKERLMLMVACSWPSYYWNNIDQKKSTESATLRIRGMALLHPVFTQFLRSRMLDFGFINDDDFPPQFSHFSAVNICSNVCRHGLSNLGWNDFFMIDFSVSFPFLRLTGCSKDLNADGVYAATSLMVNGTRVYAIVNSDMRLKLTKSGIFDETFAEYTDTLLDHATVILVTVLADNVEPRLESVKFAFALHLQEFILLRDDDIYKRFFTVSCNDGAFVYVPMSAPVLVAVPFTSNQSDNISLSFNFGHCPVPVPDPIESMLQKKQLKPLRDQALHFDGNPKLSSFFGAQDVPVSQVPVSQNSQNHPVVSMYGLCLPQSPDLASGSKRSKSNRSDKRAIPNQRTISRSALYAVFQDTFIGVRIRRRTVCIKIKDGCGFLFSFWFEHFEFGTVKWDFLPHSYFHSKDIRHFPVDTPEQFFVFMAATKLGRMCDDPLSLAAFEVMILQTINTFKGTDADPLPSVFSVLDGVVVKDSIGNFYSLLSHDGALQPSCPIAPNNSTKRVRLQDIVQPSAPTESIISSVVTETSAAAERSGPPKSNLQKVALANSHFVGLRNPKFLCPFNSLVQAWFCIKGFRNVVLCSESKEETLIELKILFYFLQIRTDCCAKELSVSPCFRTLNTRVQNDVFEVFSLLSSYLMDDGHHPSANVQRFMQDHFQGAILRRTTVDGFAPNDKIEMFLDLTLSVTDSVESSIVIFFSAAEVDDYNVGTAKVKILKRATTEMLIAALPSVLHIHLKRFDIRGKKMCDRCTFSDILDFSKFENLSYCSGQNPPRYLLQSVLVHTGSVKSGHYFVYTRPDVTNDEWWCFDDQKAVKVTKQQAIDANFGQDQIAQLPRQSRSLFGIPTAYMLIYVRDTALDELLPAPCLDVSHFNQQLLKQARDILEKISMLSASSKEAQDRLSFLRQFENHVGVLTSIVRAMSSDPILGEVLSQVEQACEHLEDIVDKFEEECRDERKLFIARCEYLADLCDKCKKQFSLQVAVPAQQSTNLFPSISVHPLEAAFSCYDTLGNIYVSCVHPSDDIHQFQVFDKGNFGVPIRVIPDVGRPCISYGAFVLDNYGRLVIADTRGHCIRIYNCADGHAVRIIGREGKKGSDNTQFRRPTSVALDTDGNVVVHDTGNNRLQVHCVQDGRFVRTVYQKKKGKFLGAGSVVFDHAGNVVFSDNDRCIRVLNYRTGERILKMTVPDSTMGDLKKPIGGFNVPGGLAIDKSGNIFMVHLQSNRLLVYRDGSLIHNSSIPIPSTSVNVQNFQKIWQSSDEIMDNARVMNVAIYEDNLMYCYENTVYVCQKPKLSSADEAIIVATDVAGSEIIVVTDTSDNAPGPATNALPPVRVSATLNALQSAASIDQYLCDAAISMALSCFEIMAPSICGYHILFVPPLISSLIINDSQSSSILPYKNMVRGYSLCVFVTGLESEYQSHGSHWLLHFYDIVQKVCFCWDPLTENCENISEYRRVNGRLSSFLWDAKETATYLSPSHQSKVQYDGLHCGVWVLLYICHFMFNGHKQLELTVDIETARRALASDFKNHRFCLDRFISCVVLPPKVMKSAPPTLPHSFWHELPVTSMENYLLLKYNQKFVLQYICRNKLQDAPEDCSLRVSSDQNSMNQRLVRHYRSTLNNGIVTVFHLGLIADGEFPSLALSSMYDIALSQARGNDGSFGIIAVGSTCSWVHVCLPICLDYTLVSSLDGEQNRSVALKWENIWKQPIPVPFDNRDTRRYDKHLSWLFNSSVCDSRWNTLIFSWNLNVFKGRLSPIAKCFKRSGLKHVVGFTQPFLKMIRCEVAVVEDAATFTECLLFIRSTPTISFDTERSVVVPNSQDPIDLLQVGTHERVFLIRVNWCAPEMLRELMLALSDCDTLIHWGGQDDVKLQRLCGNQIVSEKIKNMQNVYSSGDPKMGLYSAAFNEFKPYFTRPPSKGQKVIEEDWTMSGWNIPSLTPEQIGYAGLDVALLHLLSHHKKQPVFQSNSEYTGFVDASGYCHWHGLQKSLSSPIFGHFKSGKLEKGFEAVQQDKLSIIGFQSDSSTNFHLDVNSLQSIAVDYFDLLNNKRFCCYYCSIIIDTYMKSAPKFTIIKMQNTDTCFTAGATSHKCPSKQQNLSDCASWLCFSAVSCLFGSAEMPKNYLSLVFDDVKGGFLRLSLSPFSQSQ